MSVTSFRSVFMVASCAGAALGCYLVSLRVASERAALEERRDQDRAHPARHPLAADRDRHARPARPARALERQGAGAVGADGRPVPRRRLRARQDGRAAARGRSRGAGGARLRRPANGPKPASRGRRQQPDPDEAASRPARCCTPASLETARSAVRRRIRRPKTAQARLRRDQRLRRPPSAKTTKLAQADPLAPQPAKSAFAQPTPRTLAGSNERADARSRRPTARAASPRRAAAPNPGRNAPAADVRNAGLCRRDRPDRRCGSCASRRSATMPGARSGSPPWFRSAATSSTATASRWRGRSMPGRSRIHPTKIIGDKLEIARDAGAADAGAATKRPISPCCGRASVLLSAPPRRRRNWSRRSTRWASRASRSTASPTGSIRRPASPRMSSATPTSTATASPAWSARSTSDCPTRRPAASR